MGKVVCAEYPLGPRGPGPQINFTYGLFRLFSANIRIVLSISTVFRPRSGRPCCVPCCMASTGATARKPKQKRYQGEERAGISEDHSNKSPRRSQRAADARGEAGPPPQPPLDEQPVEQQTNPLDAADAASSGKQKSKKSVSFVA